MPPRMAIGTSQRPSPLRWGRRRRRELTRPRYLRAQPAGDSGVLRVASRGTLRIAPRVSTGAEICVRVRWTIAKEPIVSEVTLEERGRALENQFYEKENQEKLAAMKTKLDTQRSKDELRRASGMSDDAVLDRLVALG